MQQSSPFASLILDSDIAPAQADPATCWPETEAGRGIDFSVRQREFVCVGGPSGSGKPAPTHTLAASIAEGDLGDGTMYVAEAGCDSRGRKYKRDAYRIKADADAYLLEARRIQEWAVGPFRLVIHPRANPPANTAEHDRV